jgi:hypothetical protein
VIEAEEDWDRILYKDPMHGREKRLSANMTAFRGCALDAKETESTRLERARSADSTSCGGLFDGQIFERIAGRTDAECKGARKAGPPE